MRVPGVDVLVAHAAVKELHEADAVLDEAPRHQTLTRERLRDRIVQSIQLPRRLGFARHVERLGGATLHAKRELVGRNARREIGVARVLLHVELVQLGEQIETRALLLGTDARRRAEVDDGIARRSEERRVVRRWHDPGAPLAYDPYRAIARSVHL